MNRIERQNRCGAKAPYPAAIAANHGEASNVNKAPNAPDNANFE